MPPSGPAVTSHEAETQYSKAANAELAKDYDHAFHHYVKAAELFLLLSRKTTADRLRSLYRNQAAKALERAEKIKAVERNIRPAVKDHFSESEQLYVLQKSSLVNQGIFPLWDSCEGQAHSLEQPPLSAEQHRNGATWRKPAADRYRVYSSTSRALLPQDVVQHIVSDCSLCASIAVSIDHHRRFGSKIIVESLYPQDDKGEPCLSGTGEYYFRILYNGCHRRVCFDDQLPTHPDGTLMCMSTGETRQLWPSLVEKAYMKLAGGYNFDGSDSSTDLHALAGWIPEHVDLRSSDFQPEKTWDRLSEGYRTGQCVFTLGTGERIPNNTLPMRLIPVHCYAVIGVHDDDHRRLTVYDPWVPLPSHEDDRGAAHSNTVVDITWVEVRNLFDGIYLSWNPQLFKHQLSFHGLWKKEGATGINTSSHFRGQLRLQARSNSRSEHIVWLQLTRHVRSHRSNTEYISLSIRSGSGVGSSFGRDIISTKGHYTNIPHVLIKTAVSAEDLLTFVASYEGERDDVGFTLTAYSEVEISWVQNSISLLYTQDIEGSFTPKSAGGNHTYPTYYLNPQYHLRIHPRAGGSQRAVRDAKAELSVILAGDRHIPMNLTLAWSQGERINELGHNDLALSSGPYSYGYALASGAVPPGDYTLVASAFEPRHVGKFTLRVESSEKFDITAVPQEGAGMFIKTVRGEWKGASAAGGPSFGNYPANPAYELQVSARSELMFRLQLARSPPTASLNLTLFKILAMARSGAIMATSGPYSDAISGVVIPQMTLQPGRYILVPSTYSPGIQADFVLVIYSTVSGVQVTPTRMPE
ncbi:hypothetical protein BD414DRAFT_495116 [Trametes punicea]|nr:hypothetical protein BD414DRAFT_495116 [Trametes punicea]